MRALAVVERGVLVEEHRAEALIPWWSFTKSVIALAALALVRDGRLALDDPLKGRPYTLRQLLRHQAGLGDYGELAAYHEAVAQDEDPWPVSVLLDKTETDRLRYAPGQGWRYSNIGYLFVTDLLREVTDLDLPSTLEEMVLQPLGVGGVRLAQSRSDLTGVDLGEVSSYHPGWVYHGLLVGRLKDAALLLDRVLLGDFLPADLLHEMRKTYRLGGSVAGRPWKGPGYGLGLMAGETRYGWRVEGHTGGGPGSVCAIYHCPDSAAPRTAAAFAFGESPRCVESSAFRKAIGLQRRA